MPAEPFIADTVADARYAAGQTGVPVSLILAQWGLETGWGSSSAWTSGHNYAGVSPGGHVASYSGRPAGLAAYIKTLLNPRYQAVRDAGELDAATEALGSSGWATDPAYGAKLASAIATYRLDRFDTQEATSGPVAPAQPDQPTDTGGLLGGVRTTALTTVLVLAAAGLVVAGLWQTSAGQAARTAGKRTAGAGLTVATRGAL